MVQKCWLWLCESTYRSGGNARSSCDAGDVGWSLLAVGLCCATLYVYAWKRRAKFSKGEI